MHHEAFRKEAKEIEELSEKYLAEYDCPPLEIIINKKTNCPSTDEWKELKDNFRGIFIEYKKLNRSFVSMSIGDWGIILQKLIPETGEFSKWKKSYTLILSTPFHKNEEKNLFDKLEDACTNLAKHEISETEDCKNFVIIHLPRIANRKNCLEWARNYFEQFSGKPISAVLLYQPLVVKTATDQGTYISNGISFVSSEQLMRDFRTTLPMNLAFPIGKLEEPFPEHTIYVRETETSSIKVVLENSYIYQQGHHYHDAITDADSLKGTVTKIASGIFKHSVFEVFGKHISISGLYEPEDVLYIL